MVAAAAGWLGIERLRRSERVGGWRLLDERGEWIEIGRAHV